MIRTQIQLTEAQARGLRDLAAEEGRSVAELIRELVEARLRSRTRPSRAELRQRALEVSGRFRSGLGDLSSEHDRHLREAYET